MDSLTARLMSRSGLGTTGRLPAHNTSMIKAGIGLNPSKPLLPPVHNLRVVHLKEPLTGAEKDLHAARVALRDLETTDNYFTRNKLYKAMTKLQGKELQYFATRYIGRDKPLILSGWKTLFSDTVSELVKSTGEERMKYRNDRVLKHTVAESNQMAQILQIMDEDRIDTSQPDSTRLDYKFAYNTIKDVRDRINDTHELMTDTSHDIDQASVVMQSLYFANQIVKLAELLVENKREVPYDIL